MLWKQHINKKLIKIFREKKFLKIGTCKILLDVGGKNRKHMNNKNNIVETTLWGFSLTHKNFLIWNREAKKKINSMKLTVYYVFLCFVNGVLIRFKLIFMIIGDRCCLICAYFNFLLNISLIPIFFL